MGSSIQRWNAADFRTGYPIAYLQITGNAFVPAGIANSSLLVRSLARSGVYGSDFTSEGTQRVSTAVVSNTSGPNSLLRNSLRL